MNILRKYLGKVETATLNYLQRNNCKPSKEYKSANAF
jgi:hypothetical protein